MATNKPKKQPKKSLTLKPAHETLLYSIYLFGLVTAKQLCRLHFGEGSIKYVQALLKELVDHHLIQEDWRSTGRYRTPYRYALRSEGVRYLQGLGKDASKAFRDSKQLPIGPSFITHHLGVVDVVISAMLLQRENPLYYLADFIQDRQLKRQPCTVIWCEKKWKIISDAFLDLRAIMPDGKQRRVPVLLEHDCSSEFGEGLKNKVRGYIALLKSEAYKSRFEINSVTIAFTTSEGEKRRDRMREVVRQELGGDLKTLGQLFMFTNQPSPPDPKHLWLEPCWYTPEGQQALSLLAD